MIDAKPDFGIRTEMQDTLRNDRPSVFPERTWPVIRNAASHILRYQADTHEIVNADWSNIMSLTKMVNAQVSDRFIQDMHDNLSHTVGKDSQPVIPTSDDPNDVNPEITALSNAVTSRDISLLDSDNAELRTTALGLSHVVDRARTDGLRTVLYQLNETQMQKLGLTKARGTLAADLIGIFNKTNAEFLRFNARAGAALPVNPESHPEMLPEYVQVAKRLDSLLKKLESSEDMDTPADKDFIAFLRKVSEYYQVRTPEGTLISNEMKRERDSKNILKTAFNTFYGAHPDYPILIATERFKYVGNAASEDAETDLQMSDDPEIRIILQSKEDQQRNKELQENYAVILNQRYGDLLEPHTLDEIRAMIPIQGVDLGDFGVNLQRPAEGQTGDDAEDRIILMMNYPELVANFQERAEMYVAYLLGDTEEYKHIVDSQQFNDLKNLIIYLHEYGHVAYRLRGTSAELMTDQDEQWYELKSDILSATISSDVLAPVADQMFQKEGRRALNLAILVYITDNFASSSPDTEDAPYYYSGRTIMDHLVRNNVMIAGPDGAAVLNPAMLDVNLVDILAPLGGEILTLYKKVAAVKNESDVDALTQEGNAIVMERTNPLIDNMHQKLRSLLA